MSNDAKASFEHYSGRREPFMRTATLSIWLVLHAIVCAIYLAWSIPSFAMNDDPTRVLICSGALTGEPSAYLVFMNIVLGKVLAWFYSFSSTTPWYGLLLVSTQILAGSTWMVLSAERSSSFRGALVAWSLLFAFEFYALQVVEFTVAAAWCSSIGIVALVECPARRRTVVLGAVCTLLGLLIREPAFLLSAAVMFPWVLRGMWSPERSLILRRLAIVALIGASLAGVDRWA